MQDVRYRINRASCIMNYASFCLGGLKMKSQGGFTLIEIMVVLVIIAGLAYIVSTNVIGRLEKARVETTKIQIKQLETALKQFKLDYAFIGTDQTQDGSYEIISPGEDGVYPSDDDISSRNIQ